MTAHGEAANALRYALLRRLLPGIRHKMLGELQAVESLAELAARQLQADGEPREARESVALVVAHVREAVASARSMMKWLRPEPGVTIPLGEAVVQCLEVVGDDWPLRGIEATTDLRGADALVDRAALRELFAVSVVALIDVHSGPLDIDVQSVGEADHVDLTLQVRTAARRARVPLPAEPRFGWADVQALANAHGAPCTWHAHGATFRLRRIAKS